MKSNEWGMEWNASAQTKIHSTNAPCTTARYFLLIGPLSLSLTIAVHHLFLSRFPADDFTFRFIFYNKYAIKFKYIFVRIVCVCEFVVLQVFVHEILFVSNKINLHAANPIWLICEWPILMQRPQEKTFYLVAFIFASHVFRLANSQFSRQPIRPNEQIERIAIVW